MESLKISLLIFIFMASAPAQSQSMYDRAKVTLQREILNEAEWAMQQAPVTVTAQSSPRSAGGRHGFFSEGDYWWPGPKNPDNPYILRDEMTNLDNFVAHRLAMIRFNKIAGALAFAYKLTGDKKYP